MITQAGKRSLRGDTGRDQQQPDDAHRLLRVVAAVSDAVERGGGELQPPEPACPRGAARARRQAQDTAIISSAPSVMPSSGETKMKIAVFGDAGRQQGPRAGLGDRRADHAADQRVRRAGGDAVVPGDHVPDDRADQRAEDHVVVDRHGIDDALADGRRDLEVKDEDRDEVEECRPDHRLVGPQHARSRRRSRSSWPRRGNRS